MDEDDIIDLGTMEVVVDRGVLRNSRPGSYAIGRFSLPGTRARRGQEEDEGDRAPWEDGEESEEDVMGVWGDREGQPSVQFREERRRQREEERDLKEFLEENRRVEGGPAEESGSESEEIGRRGNELLQVKERDEEHDSSDDEMAIGPSPPKRIAVAAPVSPPYSRSPPARRANPPSTTQSLRAAVSSLGLSTSPPKSSSSPLKRRASPPSHRPSPPDRAPHKTPSFSLIIPTRRSTRASSAFPLTSPTKKPPLAFPPRRQFVRPDNLDADPADLMGPEEMSFEMLEQLLEGSDSEDRLGVVEKRAKGGTGLSTPPVSKRGVVAGSGGKGKGREVVEEESEDELDSLSPARRASSPTKSASPPKPLSSPSKRFLSPSKRAFSPTKPFTRASSPLKLSSPSKPTLSSPPRRTTSFPRISPELGLPMTPPPSRGYSKVPRSAGSGRKGEGREGLRSAGDALLFGMDGAGRGESGEESEDELMLR